MVVDSFSLEPKLCNLSKLSYAVLAPDISNSLGCWPKAIFIFLGVLKDCPLACASSVVVTKSKSLAALVARTDDLREQMTRRLLIKSKSVIAT